MSVGIRVFLNSKHLKSPRVSSDHDLETDSIPVTHSASETSLFESDLEHDGEIQSPVASSSNLSLIHI